MAEQNDNNKIYIGIDFGNTYSSIGFFDPRKNDIELMKDSRDDSVIPSYVSISKEDGITTVKYGMDAKKEVSHLNGSKLLLGVKYDEISKSLEF